MIVKDLFDKVDFKTLWNCYYENHIKEDDDTEEIIENARLCHELAYYRIKKLVPQINNDSILIFKKAIEELDDNEPPYEYFDVSLYSIQEIREKFIEIQKIENNYDFSKDNLEKLQEFFKNELYHITSYAFEFSPWSEILGFSVDIKSMNNIGMIEALSTIFYEMTFCGFEEDDIQEQIDEIIERKEEVEKAIEIGDISRFKPIEDLFKEFGYIDKRTQEEKDEDTKKMYLNSIENCKRIYPYLKNISNN